jgi:hypothetical protein
MRTTTQIAADIKAAAARDSDYNRVMNEGGEGYERDTTAALRAEYMASEKAEFAAVWTLDTTQARRAAWKTEMQALAAAKQPATAKTIGPIVKRLGYSLGDIQRAKALHNIK